MTQTAFELLLGALLDEGYEVHFKKHKKAISMTLNSEGIVAICGETFEQIGQLGIEAAISCGFKKIPDQGGAGKTRIDGGDQIEQHDLSDHV